MRSAAWAAVLCMACCGVLHCSNGDIAGEASAGAAGQTDAGGAGDASGGSSGSGASSSGGGGSSGAAATGGGSGGAAAGGAGGGAAGAGGAEDAGPDGGQADPCADALFCETFDGHPGVSNISDGDTFGFWKANLKAGTTMQLDGAHTRSGSSALYVHLNQGEKSGGRLFTNGDLPLFKDRPTHLYGRLMMYIGDNGNSVHWTFFGVNGDAEPKSPVTGRNAQYILSSLAGEPPNTYSFVYGLAAQGADPYRDCWARSSTAMPGGWACVAFELDSVARKLRMYKDGASAPLLSVDETGNGCVGNVDNKTPWYGPAVERLFVGAWSFHEMKGPLDVWIDDLVVDTKPVACPAN